MRAAVVDQPLEVEVEVDPSEVGAQPIVVLRIPRLAEAEDGFKHWEEMFCFRSSRLTKAASACPGITRFK